MIKVTGCRVLVKPLPLQEHDSVYASAKQQGIVIPDFSQRKEEVNVDRGHVVQIGPKCHEDYIGDLQVGDLIGYAKFGGKFMKDSDETIYLVINDEDVICIIKE